MSLFKIRSALATAFSSGGFDLPVNYDNAKKVDVKCDLPWCEFYFIPTQPVVSTLGDQGEDEHLGIVQINLNYPINEGMGNLLKKADDIRAVFKAGTSLTYQTQVVRITSCGISRAAQVVNGFYQSILTIEFRALTAR